MNVAGFRTFAKTARLSVRVLKKIKKRFGFGFRLLIEKKGSVSVRFFMSKKLEVQGFGSVRKPGTWSCRTQSKEIFNT